MKKSALVSTHTESFESILKVLNETPEIDLESIFVNEFEPKDCRVTLTSVSNSSSAKRW